eukprot:snap_masked-scaffold_12-processed-gene-12.61-mRNA-1 protein AED:1.00 eAED:1.00 QI:0/-1/0/0/-1/1/1/0/338
MLMLDKKIVFPTDRVTWKKRNKNTLSIENLFKCCVRVECGKSKSCSCEKEISNLKTQVLSCVSGNQIVLLQKLGKLLVKLSNPDLIGLLSPRNISKHSRWYFADLTLIWNYLFNYTQLCNAHDKYQEKVHLFLISRSSFIMRALMNLWRREPYSVEITPVIRSAFHLESYVNLVSEEYFSQLLFSESTHSDLAHLVNAVTTLRALLLPKEGYVSNKEPAVLNLLQKNEHLLKCFFLKRGFETDRVQMYYTLELFEDLLFTKTFSRFRMNFLSDPSICLLLFKLSEMKDRRVSFIVGNIIQLYTYAPIKEHYVHMILTKKHVYRESKQKKIIRRRSYVW